MKKDVKPFWTVINSQEYKLMMEIDSGMTFKEASEKYNINYQSLKHKYKANKKKIVSAYCQYLSAVTNIDLSYYLKLARTAYENYGDITYTVMFFEREYAQLLENYREGLPGVPSYKLPPFNVTYTEEMQIEIINLRDNENLSFREIGERLEITDYKAKLIYHGYYQRKAYEVLEQLRDEQGFISMLEYTRPSRSGKSLYELLKKEFPEYFK